MQDGIIKGFAPLYKMSIKANVLNHGYRVSSGASCIRAKRRDKENPEGNKLQY